MIKHLQALQINRLFKYVAMACVLSACAPGLEKKSAQLDMASIKQIDFKMGDVKQASLKMGVDQQSRIVKNLSDWGYPIGAKQGQHFTHTLTAEIGLVEHTHTPTGFSFSSGNSDPRALEFQKANVLPIGCELASMAAPEQTAYLTLGFAVNGKDSMSESKWIEHISTVCFNLLSELDWPEKRLEPPLNSKPSWIPEVRIETVPASTEAGKSPEKNTLIRESGGRKQIIIHNQGSPLILNFGHER